MKINKKIFTIVFLAFMLLNMLSYGGSYSNREEGINDGKYFGELDGELEGYKDYIEDNKRYWSKVISKDSEIKERYGLSDKSSTYRYYFLREYKRSFREGYENIFDELITTDIVYSKDVGIEHGIIIGELVGEIYGRIDYYSGKDNNWKNSIPFYNDIVDKYSLKREHDDYKTGFILGFRRAFEEFYTYSFRESNIEGKKLTKENGIKHGKVIGSEIGGIFGRIDYTLEKENHWASSIPNEEKIINEYRLYNETDDYSQGFIGGYSEGFRESYIKAYQDLNMDESKIKYTYYEVGMEGGDFPTDNDNLNIKIGPGTFYLDTYLSIEKKKFPLEHANSDFDPVTNIYTLDITNALDSVKLRKPIILSFKYEGTDKGGVYKKVGSRWIYMPSFINDGKIFTTISSKSYRGGTYAVFNDENIKPLSDMWNHWGKDEIYTYVRRQYIRGYSDDTFKPGKNVSRGEFVTILNRIFNWERPIKNVDLNKFKDHMVFGVYSDSIINAYSRNYISGYPDNTFRPNIPITYQEIEWLIRRIPGNSKFRWNDISEKLKREKGVISNSYTSMKKHISRSEVVYLLYTLEEGGLLY